jgi:hypothetical protein
VGGRVRVKVGRTVSVGGTVDVAPCSDVAVAATAAVGRVSGAVVRAGREPVAVQPVTSKATIVNRKKALRAINLTFKVIIYLTLSTKS